MRDRKRAFVKGKEEARGRAKKMADTKAQGHRQQQQKVAKYVTCKTTTQVSACKPSALKLRSR